VQQLQRGAHWVKHIHRLGNKIGQLIIVVFVAVLMLEAFYLVNIIQGTGRVINYAGIVRGASQRLVKLEISKQPDDELVEYLDDIIRDLHYGGGKYNVIKLKDDEYIIQLNSLIVQWENLKASIRDFRQQDNDSSRLMGVSEDYFDHANVLVGLAEEYAEAITGKLRICEILLSIGIVALILISLQQTYYELTLVRKNKELRAAAYLDKLTGIPGRRSCEEALWYPVDVKKSPFCVIMIDLNNLKLVNDKLGHHTGDRLIKAFAEILYKFSSEKVFTGRYGGDEFLCIVHDYEEEMVQRLLNDIKKEVDEFNQKESKFQIQYACGYEYGGETLPKMLEKADLKMYENKKQMKDASS
jgi:diguanylate cyclase (GGDEF)-like protein